MTPFQPLAFRLKPVKQDLVALSKLLKSKADLSERADILPFFKARPYLSAFLAYFTLETTRPDRIRHEFGISGDFGCDLVVGDSNRRSYCFIEFEDAAKDSVFKSTRKGTPEWSARFEHGFSQLVDWFYRLDDEANLKKWATVFGSGHVRYSGMLVAGRDAYIAGNEDRLRWRSERITRALHDLRPALARRDGKAGADANQVRARTIGLPRPIGYDWPRERTRDTVLVIEGQPPCRSRSNAPRSRLTRSATRRPRTSPTR